MLTFLMLLLACLEPVSPVTNEVSDSYLIINAILETADENTKYVFLIFSRIIFLLINGNSSYDLLPF